MLRWRGGLRPDDEGSCPVGTGEPLKLYREGVVRLFSCRKLTPADSWQMNWRWESLWAGMPVLAVARPQCSDSGSSENLVKEGGGGGDSLRSGLVDWVGGSGSSWWW